MSRAGEANRLKVLLLAFTGVAASLIGKPNSLYQKKMPLQKKHFIAAQEGNSVHMDKINALPLMNIDNKFVTEFRKKWGLKRDTYSIDICDFFEIR